MNAAQIAYDVFYDLVNEILNVKLSLDVQIVQAYQDAPAPTVQPYIAIELPSLASFGHTHSKAPDNAGDVGRVVDWTGSTGIWQIGGDGDLLRQIIQRLDFQEIKDFLSAKKTAIFSTPQYATLPRTEEQQWVREYRLDVSFGLAIQANEPVGWIESAEITPEHIGGLQ